MKYYKTLSAFYTSREWAKFRNIIIQERKNERGETIDEVTGLPIFNKYDIIIHHKEELTLANVNNPEISLNPKNVMIVSFKTHNEIHGRFGFDNCKTVYLVTGSPLSGKSSFVKSVAGKDDVIIDLDTIWECFSNNERYIKPDTIKSFVFNVYNSAIDNITTRVGKWNNAYVVGSFPRVMERKRMLDKLGAKLVHIDTSKEECISRLMSDERRQLVKEEYLGYIEKYFNDYQPDELLDDDQE